MTLFRRIPVAVVAGALALAACGSDSPSDGAAESPATEATAADTTEMAEMTEMTEMTDATEATEATDMTDTAATADMADTTDMAEGDGDDEMADLSAWQTLPLTDVQGESFTIADFVGTPVFVENFATWCPNCRKQLATTNEAAAELGEEAVFLALSTETDLSPEAVADYATDNGFTSVRFAVMTPEFLAEISAALGTTAINPPSTPHVTIDASGMPGDLVTGFEDVDDIVATVRAAS